MARKINAFEFTKAPKVSRPGVHAKTKTSKHKKSPNYRERKKKVKLKRPQYLGGEEGEHYGGGF